MNKKKGTGDRTVMGKHLVLAGAGHAHLTTLAAIGRFVERGHRVTVVSPSPYLYYSGMGAGGLSGVYAPADMRIDVRRITEKNGGVFIAGRVAGLDAESRKVFLDSGMPLSYDVVSFNTGSYVQSLRVFGNSDIVCYVKPVENLVKARADLTALFKTGPTVVSIVGGGPSAVEIAGNVSELARSCGEHSPLVNIFARNRFMGTFHNRVRSRAIRLLNRRGVEIYEYASVAEVRNGRVILESGNGYASDYVFIATGVKPSPLFKESRLPVGIDGGLPVNSSLQMDEYPEVFGGGDCIYFKKRALNKVGVYAVRQNQVLCDNLLAMLEGRGLKAFDPGKPYMLIMNMGGGIGLLARQGLAFDGRLAFRLKDYIDRKFIRKFQAEERGARGPGTKEASPVLKECPPDKERDSSRQ